MKKILVVGMGLIGGSLAMALQGFEDYEVVGVVRSTPVGVTEMNEGDSASTRPNILFTIIL